MATASQVPKVTLADADGNVYSAAGVTGGLTNTELRATPVPVSGTVTTTALTDTQLRATPVPVSGTVATGALTDTQLRATSVPVDTELPTATAIGATSAGSAPVVQALLQGFDSGTSGLALYVASAVADAGSGSRMMPYVAYVFNGATYDKLRVANKFIVVNLGLATAEATIWTPASGKKFRLMGILLTCGVASTLTFKDNTAGTTIFAARGTTDTPINSGVMGNGILSAAANNVLTVTRGTACTLDGVVFGTEE